MTRVLLVTGARSLVARNMLGATITEIERERIDAPKREAWARGLIHAALAGVDLLIVGDASGPDAWAAEIASSHDKRVRRYDTHGVHAGWIVQQEHALWCRMDQWATRAMQGRRYPLHRNAAMVRDVTAMAMRRDASAHVLALVDPASETKGTEHTAGLAERAGLTVQREVWR